MSSGVFAIFSVDCPEKSTPLRIAKESSILIVIDDLLSYI